MVAVVITFDEGPDGLVRSELSYPATTPTTARETLLGEVAALTLREVQRVVMEQSGNALQIERAGVTKLARSIAEQALREKQPPR